MPSSVFKDIVNAMSDAAFAQYGLDKATVLATIDSLLEVDIVALEMMVLRVLSAESSGKQSLDVAGLLKIRGSELQQRYTELMMLAGVWPMAPRTCLLDRMSCRPTTSAESSVMFFWAASITRPPLINRS